MPALALATSELVRAANASFPPATTEVAATLPVRAHVAYEIFADTAETPRWLSVIQAAHVLERGADGRPAKVSFRAGVPARLTFVRTTDKTCGTEVTIPSLNIKRALPLNEPVDIDFTPANTGDVAFVCGMNMLRGSILVQ